MSRVGKIIDAFCARCGLPLAHTVLYEVGGAVHGVKCRTCGSEHRYHGPKPDRRHSLPPRRRPGLEAGRPRQPVRPADTRQWELKDTATGPDTVVWDYKVTDDYEKGDVIDHPRFGRGFVASKTEDRMEVLFREGRKQMAINRRPATTGADES